MDPDGRKSKQLIESVIAGGDEFNSDGKRHGRPNGAKNKKTNALIERFQKIAFDEWGIEEWTPFDWAVKIASCPDDFIEIKDNGKPVVDDKGNPVKERLSQGFKLQCSRFVSEFTYHKLKSIELTPGNMGGRFKVNLQVNVEGQKTRAPEDVADLVNQLDEATDDDG